MELHNLSELKGKRIAVGAEGSGTKALAITLVKLFLPLVSWRSRSKIYHWYRTLNDIEDEMGTYDELQRREAVSKFEQALQKIQKVDVPLSYRREYYDLIQHFELILGKLRMRG